MNKIFKLYESTILNHPKTVLIVFLLVLALSASKIHQFRLDASEESLVLENSQATIDFKESNEKFASSEEFLLVTYSPQEFELFSDTGISTLQSLRNELAAIDGIKETNSILNVPLLHSPNLSLNTVDTELKTIDDDDINPQVAKESLLNNPLYPELIISKDAKTTGIQLILNSSEEYKNLLIKKYSLRAKLAQESSDKSAIEKELSKNKSQIIKLKNTLNAKQDKLIDDVRVVLNKYSDNAQLYLGGVPMIVVDMIRFIKNDISVFGIGVLIFLIITLAVIFRQWRLVVAPLVCCIFTAWIVSGYLAWTNWPITVISSNFISLLLIITLSLTIHVIVRYRECQRSSPNEDNKANLKTAIKHMVKPCFFMVITTIVAFSSFIFSGILPVIDFGLMMTIGLVVAFLVTFIIFPSIISLLPPKKDMRASSEKSIFTFTMARFTEKRLPIVIMLSVLIAIGSAVGISRLSVENSFIDYFKSDTEIYQGMLAIDNHLGGTTPLDIIISKDTSLSPVEEECDPFIDDNCDEANSGNNGWFSYQNIEKLRQVHKYLDGLKETGKVLSLVTTIDMIEQINRDKKLSEIELAFVPTFLPGNLKGILLNPYYYEETQQVRFTIRLLDSMPGLQRQKLLEDINSELTNQLGFKQEQVLITGMTVIYNDMLQSLFDSQIKTLAVVFIAIMLMFLVLFRSILLSIIGIIPNMLAAASLLGLMGILNIPLDMMTITVAAITVGMAVDNTIHYIHRFEQELNKEGSYITAMYTCHRTIGRAMFYTSLTTIIGFSILVLSNFIPTIYFGMFTGFAMLMALLAALTLLPALIILIKPYGKVKA